MERKILHILTISKMQNQNQKKNCFSKKKFLKGRFLTQDQE